MTIRYVLSRVVAQLSVLFLGVVIYSPWLEQSGPLAQQTDMNAFMYTFITASLPPIWRRGVALKARAGALAMGAAAAIPVGVINLVGANIAFSGSRSLVAILLAGLIVFVGPAFGWCAAIGTLRWFAKHTITSANDIRVGCVKAPQEVVAFRFLLLMWGLGFLIAGGASYAYVEAAAAQKWVKYFAKEMDVCWQNALASTPACHEDSYQARSACDQRTHVCWDNTVPGYPHGLEISADQRVLWSERADDALWLAVAVVVLSSILFYGIRWGLTGRVRPLWLLGGGDN